MTGESVPLQSKISPPQKNTTRAVLPLQSNGPHKDEGRVSPFPIQRKHAPPCTHPCINSPPRQCRQPAVSRRDNQPNVPAFPFTCRPGLGKECTWCGGHLYLPSLPNQANTTCQSHSISSPLRPSPLVSRTKPKLHERGGFWLSLQNEKQNKKLPIIYVLPEYHSHY